MKNISLFITLCLFGSSQFFFQEELGWRGIVPLRSTRADVDRLLGTPREECQCLYKTRDAVILIDYALSPCKGALTGWNVPPDTVLRLTARSKDRQRFIELNLDLSKYVERQDDTLTRYFTSMDEGIEYEVSSDGIINSISFIPSLKNSHLRCHGLPTDDGSITTYSPFDSYSNASLADAKLRLDPFAIQLHQNPNTVGYIIIYTGRNTHADEARAHAKCAKSYLVNKRNLKASRIVTIEGGRRERFTVELYLVPDGVPPPAANPPVTVNAGESVNGNSNTIMNCNSPRQHQRRRSRR